MSRRTAFWLAETAETGRPAVDEIRTAAALRENRMKLGDVGKLGVL